ncbi:AbrB/MazE/SpoVT family DNA-binding domain-containing protein [Candidatus Pacearchaeota archaeon]|nr:AbrB/MazE/SpoVT family DNA-binding domain-containing protein [Candidatus Pacearchaeota archaeon]
MEIKTRAKKWGSSLAVIIPKEVVEKRRIKENSELTITIEGIRPKAGVLFGFLKGKIKEPTQKIKDEMRRGWLSESDREREWK